MGNPQVTESRLGWLAGILDGEGSVIMAKVKRAWGYNYSPRIAITNTDEEIVREVEAILNALGIRYYYSNRASGGLGTKPIVDIILTRLQDLADLIKLLAPHTVGIKKQRMLIMLQFLLSRITKKHLNGKNSMNKLTESEIALAESIRNQTPQRLHARHLKGEDIVCSHGKP